MHLMLIRGNVKDINQLIASLESYGKVARNMYDNYYKESFDHLFDGEYWGVYSF